MNISSTSPTITASYSKPSEYESSASQQPQPATEKNDNKLKSFGYGLVGMDKPEEVQENDDTAYTAGQVLKAIGTVGSIIAIIV